MDIVPNGQLTIFDGTEYEDEELKRQLNDPNPMVHLHGYGPKDETCKGCKHLFAKWSNTGKKFFKCQLHGDTNGPVTDHRLKYNACALYEPATFIITGWED